MGKRVTYECIDCGYGQEVSKRKANCMDGLRCPKCGGPFFLPTRPYGYKETDGCEVEGVIAPNERGQGVYGHEHYGATFLRSSWLFRIGQRIGAILR